MDNITDNQNPQTQTQGGAQPISYPLEPQAPTFEPQAPAPENQAPAYEEPIASPEPQATVSTDDNAIDDQLSSMSNEEVVASFAEGLLEEKDLGEMDEATKKDMINDLIERINDFINRAVLESLPAEKLDELDTMIENGTATPEAVAQLIQNSGIDAGAVSVEAMAKFREVYLGDTAEQEA